MLDYFKTTQAKAQYQMEELMKNVNPTKLGIGMLGNYKEAEKIFKQQKTFSLQKIPLKTKSSKKFKISVKVKHPKKGKNPKEI